MALPVIIFNSSTGSDSAASGAGPGTALTGTGASLNASTSIDLSADSPDLSGVATDGSAVLWVNSSSGRQFFKITAVDNGTKIVTVANAATPTESGKTWAIGGKRNSFNETNSRKLFSADVLPGWIIETETAQTITASTLTGGVSGDTTSGQITVRGATGVDHPTITTTAAAAIFTFTNINKWTWTNVKLANSNATKATAFSLRGTGYVCRDVIFGDATNKLLSGLSRGGGSVEVTIQDCEIAHCTGDGIDVNNSSFAVRLLDSWVHDCTLNGVEIGNSSVIHGCVIEGNGGDGINFAGAPTFGPVIHGNTVHGNTGDGLDSTGSSALDSTVVTGNIFSNNGGYGWRGSSGQDLVGFADANNYYSNTSGARLNAPTGPNDLALDPTYTNAAGNDFSIGTNLKAAGLPLTSRYLGANQSATRSYEDIGGAQRQEAGGGGGPLIGGRLVR